MVGALGQYQHLAALAEGVLDFVGNCGRAGLIIGEVPEHILNSRVGREVDPCMHRIRYRLEVVRCTGRFCCCVPYRATLHEDDRLLAVAAERRGGQADHVFRLGLLQDGVE